MKAMKLTQHGRDIIAKIKRPKLDIDKAQIIVSSLCPDVNSNQFSALVSFAVRVGESRFRRSRVVRFVQEGRMFEVPKELLSWGRRQEAALFKRFVLVANNGR